MDKIIKIINVSIGRYWFYFFLIVAIVIKFSLFFYIVTVIPVAVIDPDSPVYFQGADSIRAFLLHPQYGLTHNSQACPGYPPKLPLWIDIQSNDHPAAAFYFRESSLYKRHGWGHLISLHHHIKTKLVPFAAHRISQRRSYNVPLLR